MAGAGVPGYHAAMATSYWDYIRVGELLGLQQGIEGDEAALSDDEVVFITVHQVYELWFKLVLRQLTSLRDLLAADVVPEEALAGACAGLNRCVRILRVAAHHFEVVESIQTRDYLAFRDKLFPASGFQSAQMREIEILLGLPSEERIPFGSDATAWLEALKDHRGKAGEGWQRVQARLKDRPTVRGALEAWLHRTPIRGSQPGDDGDDEVVSAFLSDYRAAHEKAVRRLVDTIGPTAGMPPAALEARYEREMAGAREFLEIGEPRRRRIRAALVFIESYRELPLLAWPRQLLAGLIEVEQAFTVFRQRHARMVERVIGRRTGTGGSAGVDYLDETALRYRVFRDLWAVRTLQLAAADLPPLAEADAYGFRRSHDT